MKSFTVPSWCYNAEPTSRGTRWYIRGSSVLQTRTNLIMKPFNADSSHGKTSHVFSKQMQMSFFIAHRSDKELRLAGARRGVLQQHWSVTSTNPTGCSDRFRILSQWSSWSFQRTWLFVFSGQNESNLFIHFHLITPRQRSRTGPD